MQPLSMTETGLVPDYFLPVYNVAGTGINEEEARKLAESLKLPVEKLLLQKGMASFVDPTKYLAVPTVFIDDPEIVAAHRKATKNHHPQLPIQVKAIDYAALGKLTALEHFSV